MRPHHRGVDARVRAAWCALLAVLSLVWFAPAAAANDELDDLRERVDDVAQRWFDAQEEADRIDAEIRKTEAELETAQQRARAVRAEASARALDVYRGGSVSYADLLDSGNALEIARRAQLADSANAQSNAAFDALEDVSHELRVRHDELESLRETQAEKLADLEEQRRALDAELELARRAADAERAAANARARTMPRAAAAPASAPARTGQADDQASPSTNPPAPPATEPPAPVAPPPAPGGVHPRHDHPFLVCTRMRESGGNYGIVSPHGYYGAYQFLPTTWNATAAHAGRPELIGVLPSRASEYDQDDLAWVLYQWQGKDPWGGRC